jgi:hypothetical protein
MVGCSEHGYEPSGSIKDGNFWLAERNATRHHGVGWLAVTVTAGPDNVWLSY